MAMGTAMATDPRLPAPALRATVAAGLLMLLASPAAHAESVQIRPQLSVGVLVLEAREAGRDRAQVEALNVSPSVGLRLHGARVKIDGSVGVEAVVRSDDSSARSVRPRGGVQMRLIPILNALDVDLSATAERVGANPFGPRPDGLSSENEATSLRYRVAPTFARVITTDLSVLARSEHVWNRVLDVPEGSATVRGNEAEEQEFRIERSPLPTGWTLEGLRQRGRLSSAERDTIELQAARGVMTFAATDQLVMGLSLGRERAQYEAVDRVDTVYGLRARWLPSQRTEFKAQVEKRFFGNGFEVEGRHRTPSFGLAVRAFREPLVQAGRNMQDPSFTNVSYILSDILTTRNPDAVSREAAVRGIVNSLGLTQPLARAMELNPTYAQMHEGGSGTVVLYNRGTLFSATAYLKRQERLDEVDAAAVQGGLNGDIEQRGLDFGLKHRLSARLSVDVGLRVGQVRGLKPTLVNGQLAKAWSDDRSLSAGALYALSPNASLYMGLRHQRFDANVYPQTEETSLSANLVQRF